MRLLLGLIVFKTYAAIQVVCEILLVLAGTVAHIEFRLRDRWSLSQAIITSPVNALLPWKRLKIEKEKSREAKVGRRRPLEREMSLKQQREPAVSSPF